MSSSHDPFNEAAAKLAQRPLSYHEAKVKALLLSLYGTVQGFPDTVLKLNNVTRAWAAFVSLEPHHVQFNPQIEQFVSEEDKQAFQWKEGIIPGEWLIEQVRNSCEWMPAPVAAREIYCAHFPPLDGLTIDKLQVIGRKNIRPADTEAS